ncbi:MAG TPA: hypothetical protein VJC08_01440, partial [bacterium]|nr:hypothetical protein [bacterium]
MANIERFAEGLRTLQSRGELTRDNLLNLLKPSAINAYLTSPGGELAYGTTMSADPAAVVSKSEIRLETPRSETRTAAAVKTRLQELIDLDLKPGDILKIGSNQYVIKASRIPRVMSNGSLEAGLIEADEINESGKVISTPTMSYGEFLKSIPNGDLEVVKASSTSEYRYKLPMDEEARSVGMKDASAAEQFLFKVLQNNPEIVQDFRSRGISNTGLMSLHHSKDKKGNIIYKLSGKTKGEETRDFEVITTSEGNLVDYRPYGNSEKNNGLDLDLVGNALRAVGGPRKVFEGHAVIRPNGAVLIEDITPADLVEKGIQVVSLTTVDTNGKAVTLKLQIQEGKLRNISSFFSEEQYKDNSSGETFNYFAKQHVSAVFVPVASGVNATETPQPGANKTDFDDVKLEGSPGGSRAKPAETTKIILKEAAESAPVVARTKKDGAEKKETVATDSSMRNSALEYKTVLIEAIEKQLISDYIGSTARIKDIDALLKSDYVERGSPPDRVFERVKELLEARGLSLEDDWNSILKNVLRALMKYNLRAPTENLEDLRVEAAKARNKANAAAEKLAPMEDETAATSLALQGKPALELTPLDERSVTAASGPEAGKSREAQPEILSMDGTVDGQKVVGKPVNREIGISYLKSDGTIDYKSLSAQILKLEDGRKVTKFSFPGKNGGISTFYVQGEVETTAHEMTPKGLEGEKGTVFANFTMRQLGVDDEDTQVVIAFYKDDFTFKRTITIPRNLKAEPLFAALKVFHPKKNKAPASAANDKEVEYQKLVSEVSKRLNDAREELEKKYGPGTAEQAKNNVKSINPFSDWNEDAKGYRLIYEDWLRVSQAPRDLRALIREVEAAMAKDPRKLPLAAKNIAAQIIAHSEKERYPGKKSFSEVKQSNLKKGQILIAESPSKTKGEEKYLFFYVTQEGSQPAGVFFEADTGAAVSGKTPIQLSAEQSIVYLLSDMGNKQYNLASLLRNAQVIDPSIRPVAAARSEAR